MNTYRTGNCWGVTIVREAATPPPDHDWHEGGPCDECRPDDELVAVVVNGDQALAERICTLLNAGETEPYGAKRDWVTDNSPQLAEWLSEQGARGGRPHPGPVGPGCICDGSGRTCPRHGVVL